MKKHPRRARGFTLIELLAVIAIIGTLAAMTFGLYGFIKSSQREAKARGEIKLLEAKLEEFKGRFGDYPMAESGAEEEWQRTLFNALTGRWSYRKTTGADGKPMLTWDKSLEFGNENNLRPFISGGEIGTDLNVGGGNTATKFVDPWGNAYRYRFGTLNSGKVNNAWDRPSILLISAGNKFSANGSEAETNATLPDKDFFSAGEAVNGIIQDDYFEEQFRSDNLTNFGNK